MVTAGANQVIGTGYYYVVFFFFFEAFKKILGLRKMINLDEKVNFL